jgi:hypothetical protein
MLRFGNFLLVGSGFKRPKKVNNAFYLSFKEEQKTKQLLNKVLADIKDMEDLINQLENERKLTRESWQNLKIQVINMKKDYKPRIKELNTLQYNAYLKMKKQFEDASEAWNKGDRAGAKPLSVEGHKYKDEAKSHTADRKALEKEITDLELKRDETYAKLQEIEKLKSDNQAKIADLKTKDLEEAEKNYKKSKEDYKILQDANSVVQLTSIAPNLSQTALSMFSKYYFKEYMPAKTKEAREQKAVEWFEENGVKIELRNGFSKDYGCWTTDLIITARDSNDGSHMHIIFDEYGDQIFCREKPNK